MALRLVATLPSGTTRFQLPPGRSSVGSAPGCAVRLDHPSVSRQHALLEVSGDDIVVEDCASSNGTIVGSRRVSRARISLGEPIYFGRVAAYVERITHDDTTVGVAIERPGATSPQPDETEGLTAHLAPVDTFALQHLPGLLRRAAGGATRTELAAAVGHALFTTLPALELEIRDGAGGGAGLLFRAASPAQPPAAPIVVEQSAGGTIVTAVFASATLAEAYAGLIESAAWLLAAGGGGAAVRSRHSGRPNVPPPPPDPPSLVPEVQRIYRDAARVAAGGVGVLVTGESGTGKEVLARYVHAASPWAAGPFVALNCAALPRDLLESELFGIERGVATGVDARPGKFELADGGTLFLDEIGDMALDTQARILRVLQEREVYRLGGREARSARARIVAATNRDIGPMLRDGRFREDLYHRIATWVVELPPLRRRQADVPQLAVHFLAQAAGAQRVQVRGISRAALDALLAYGWPGNIRQLENEMSRAVLFLSDGDLLETAHLHPEIRDGRTWEPAAGHRLHEVLAAVERQEILKALRVSGQDVGGACERLGVSRATLYRRLKALGIEQEST